MSNVSNIGETIRRMRRQHLEVKFAKAAHELLEYINSAAMTLPIPNTTPQQYIAIGTATEICGLLLPQSPVATAVQTAIEAMPQQPCEVIHIGVSDAS